MSESREHKRRYVLKLEFVAAFEKWLKDEPPMIRIIKWRRWIKARPVWKAWENDYGEQRSA